MGEDDVTSAEPTTEDPTLAPIPESGGGVVEPEPEQHPESMVSGELSPAADLSGSPTHRATQLEQISEAQGQGIQASKEQVGNFDQDLQALKDAHTEAQSWAHLKAVQSFAKEQQDANKEMLGGLALQANKYRAAVDNLKNINPNPWASRGTGFAIGSAISVALNQLGSGILGQNSNTAKQVIDDALHRDLQQQQLQYEQAKDAADREGTIYGQMRELYADKSSAMAASFATAKELVASRAQASLMAMAPQMRTLQAQKMVAQLQADSLEAKQKSDSQNFQTWMQARGIEDRERAMAQAERYRKLSLSFKHPSGGVFALAGLKGKVELQAREIYDSYLSDLVPSKQGLTQFFQMPLADQMQPENANMAHSLVLRLSQGVKAVRGQGVRFSEKLQEIDQALSSGIEGTRQAALKDLATGGQYRKIVNESLALMEHEYKTRMESVSGRPIEYWVRANRDMIDQQNQADRYANGVGDTSGSIE